jgi:hypothetical protein
MVNTERRGQIHGRELERLKPTLSDSRASQGDSSLGLGSFRRIWSTA